MNNRLAGAAFLAALLISTPGFSADAILTSGIQTADMDVSARPQDDLFQYANGTWLRNVAIPADRSSYGVDSIMSERSVLQQRELLEAAKTSPDPEARKVGWLTQPRTRVPPQATVTSPTGTLTCLRSSRAK